MIGISSRSFLLGATIDLHLERALEETKDVYEKDIIQKLKQSFYVDKCVTSTKSEKEAIILGERTISILAEGGFELKGWQLLDNLSSDKIPVLKLIWDVKEDTLILAPTILLQKALDLVMKQNSIIDTKNI